MNQKCAVIGSGIAGMASAYFLAKNYEVTLFEKQERFGGHTNTVEVNKTPFDTGFMVFNNETYPNLIKLFDHLDVPILKTEMSFSVQNKNTGLEWSGAGLKGLFSQKRNLFAPSYIKFLLEIDRFNKLAHLMASAEADKNPDDEISIEDFAKKEKFSERFLTDYLIPMSGAVWSTPYHKMLHFPAKTLIRFFKNHGLLGLNTHFQWFTVKGGSREYRDRLLKPILKNCHVSQGIASVEVLKNQQVELTLADGSKKTFDKVVIAAHADEALALLKNPTAEQSEILSCFKYQKNDAVVHSDPSVMPEKPINWSSWNFRYEKSDDFRSSTIYYMNRLQSLPEEVPYFVSINSPEIINPKLIHQKMVYDHPVFDLKAIQAQKKIPSLNQTGPLYFVGSYQRYGFHEDALWSALQVSLFLTDKRKIEDLLW